MAQGHGERGSGPGPHKPSTINKRLSNPLAFGLPATVLGLVMARRTQVAAYAGLLCRLLVLFWFFPLCGGFHM